MVLADLHPSMHEVRTQRTGWNLQAHAGENHGVVLVDLAVFLHTQDLTFSQYLALLSVADAFLVTSLREGMALRYGSS